MDAQQFLAEFGHIANAPGGVALLRELILELAIKGNLVTQLSHETNVKANLLELARRREKILREKNISATRKHKNFETPQGWFQVPENWAWEYLGYLSVWPLKDGDWIESKDQDPKGDVRIVQLADIGVGTYKNKSQRFLTASKANALACYFLEVDDVLIARLPDPLGRACIFPGDTKPSVTVVDVAVCRCDANIINPRYLMNCINSPSVRKLIDSWAVGTTRQRVATGKLGSITLPIAPLEEQSRIVAKVDELMALCDKLETQQQDRRKLQSRLRQSTLQAVATATSPHELQTTWTRLADNFGQLFHAPEDVADLRKMITELAIRGALDAFSEPTDVTTVDVYLAKLASKKSGKRFATVGQVEEDIPLPNGWRWVLMEDLLADSESGWSPKCDAEPRRIGEWGVLKVSAVTWGAFNPEANKRLPSSLESRPECEVKPGDFMLSRANTAELVARSVIAPDDCPEKLLMSDKIVRLIFLDNKLKPWVNLVNNSEMARTYYKERATGTSDSMRNVSRQVIHELPIPLPSLHVQKRVLLALNRLMRFCDELERQTSSRMKLSGQLSTTAVSSLTGIATEQEEEPMKAPQTELIAPLRLGKTPDIKAQAPLATILARYKGEMPAKDLWQRFGGEIDAFYAQLKTEVAHGWIVEPMVLRLRDDLDSTSIPEKIRHEAQLTKLLKDYGNAIYEGDLRERFGRGVDAFSTQLKIEMGYGWIIKASAAEMRAAYSEKEEV